MEYDVDSLVALIRRYTVVPTGEMDRFVARLKPREIEQSEHLCRIGQISGELAYVTEGIIRRYARHGDREVNVALLREGSFAAAFTSLTTRSPSSVALQALEDTRMLVISLEDLEGLDHPCWRQFAVGAAAGKLEREVARGVALRELPAQARYARLLETWPDVELRVPQHHIASYLGIAPETLSRLRRRS